MFSKLSKRAGVAIAFGFQPPVIVLGLFACELCSMFLRMGRASFSHASTLELNATRLTKVVVFHGMNGAKLSLVSLFRAVQPLMFAMGQQHQVFNHIIFLISVLMVDAFVFFKDATEMFLHQGSAPVHLSSSMSHYHVAVADSWFVKWLPWHCPSLHNRQVV